MAERLCSAYSRDFGLEASVLRGFNIYGPGQDPCFLIPTIIAQARAGKIELQSGDPKRDFVFVGDVAEAYIQAIATSRPGCRIFNIASGSSISVAEVAEMIRQRVNPHASLTFSGNMRKGEIIDTRADIGLAQAELGWRPRTALDAGLDQCLAP